MPDPSTQNLWPCKCMGWPICNRHLMSAAVDFIRNVIQVRKDKLTTSIELFAILIMISIVELNGI